MSRVRVRKTDKKRPRIEDNSDQAYSERLQIHILDRIVDSLSLKAPQGAFTCRENEIQTLLAIVQRASTTKGHVVRIYGQPGTGKTYTVARLLQMVHNERAIFEDSLSPRWDPQLCILNGAMIQTPQELLRQFASLVVPDEAEVKAIMTAFRVSGVVEAMRVLKNACDTEMHIVAIDEEDQLCGETTQSKKGNGKMEQVLTQLKALAVDKRIVFICISNVVRLDKESLVRRKQIESETVLMFDPYTEEQLGSILNQRIQVAKDASRYRHKLVHFNPFAGPAQTFILKQMATHKGDCRYLLNACRGLIHHRMSELQTPKRPRDQRYPTLLVSQYSRHGDEASDELSSPNKKSSQAAKDGLIELTSAVQLMKTQQSGDQRSLCGRLIENLPLQQQIVLCAVCAVLRKTSCQANFACIDTQTVHKGYQAFCETHALSMEYRTEMQLIEAIGSLECMGLLRATSKSKGYKTMQIEMHFDLDCLCAALKRCKRFFNVWLTNSSPND